LTKLGNFTYYLGVLNKTRNMTLNTELLEQSFELVKPQAASFTTTFYSTLFDRSPEVKPLFVHTAMQEQGQKLFQSLQLVIDSLRKPEALTQALKSLGTRHIKYGVLPQHYPLVGAALLAALELHTKEAWTAEVLQAWKEAYAAVTQLMLEGADYPNEILEL
jgi:hemoglobin-like flavoprotein